MKRNDLEDGVSVMNPNHQTMQILRGNALDVLRTLPDASVHCVVTSPPYWSMRDYGVPATAWPDGTEHCLGLEPTPELYVEHLCMVFDEVARVLRTDGTLWLNLGDCHAGGGRGGHGTKSRLQGSTAYEEHSRKAGSRLGSRSSFSRDRVPRGDVAHKAAPGVKPKDLIGVPWMVAFALRARGWYLRMDNLWFKTNPKPEAARDRTTRAHEYVFHLSKSKHYFYDAESIREGVSSTSAGRNRRSVWRSPTAQFKGAHFAVMPANVVETCVLAGTSACGCCQVCGAPFARIVERGEPLLEQQRRAGGSERGEYRGKARKLYREGGAEDPSALKARVLDGMRERKTTGWRATCRHTLVAVDPCVVLDPFSGAGTTGFVAAKLGRSFIGVELNPEYAGLAESRIATVFEARLEASV